ncbi:MAG: hypothetical protein ABJH45_22680 [Paracoccaceae bacterium]
MSLLATSGQLYLSFLRQNDTLSEVTSQIETGFGRGLGAALRDFDTRQIEHILGGIYTRNEVASVTLRSPEGLLLEHGSDVASQTLQIETVTLLHKDPVRGDVEVGTLDIGLSRAEIWANLYAQALVFSAPIWPKPALPLSLFWRFSSGWSAAICAKYQHLYRDPIGPYQAPP